MNGIESTRALRRFLDGVARLVMGVTLMAVATQAGAQGADQPMPKLSPELEAVRAKIAKYQDPILAVHDGYFSTLGCVQHADGAMGVHFLNPALIGPVPDPAAPPILMYEPDKAGKLHLVAVEWLVPLATGVKERPKLFGQSFKGPMEGHEPLLPKQLHHYDMHAWLFRENPGGVFHNTNSNVDCGNSAYALKEAPPPEVPQN